MKNDLVSIIIPTLNESKNIEACLTSIKNQNYRQVEIIVVDNFSKDQTLDISRKYTKKCYQKGSERSPQRNFGAQKAQGKYLLFLDADMQLAKGTIQDAINKTRSGNIIVAIPELSVGQNFWEKSIALERNLYQNEEFLAAARFFPKDIFLRLKGFDNKLIAGEDWDITIRAQNLKYKLVFGKTPIIHNENVQSLKAILKKKNYYSRNIVLYAKKHPEEFKKQSSFQSRFAIIIKNLPKLLADPLHTFGFIILKILIWYDWRIK